MNYIFDTNVFLIYMKNAEAKSKLTNNFSLSNPDNISILSIVTLGEIYALALKNNWGEKRVSAIDFFVKKFVIVDVTNSDLIQSYAQIDAFSQGKLIDKPLRSTARNMGKNDLWIAATAAVTKSTLLTTDKDFVHLDGAFFDLELFKPVDLL